jgi:hypothetical protein
VVQSVVVKIFLQSQICNIIQHTYSTDSQTNFLQVANPHDILLFTKAAKKRASTDGILLTLVFLLSFEEPFELSLGLINRVIPCP